eukprot:SAG11_NODE_11416_length_762_cov_1.093514_2_plen_87_part_00
MLYVYLLVWATRSYKTVFTDRASQAASVQATKTAQHPSTANAKLTRDDGGGHVRDNACVWTVAAKAAGDGSGEATAQSRPGSVCCS